MEKKNNRNFINLDVNPCKMCMPMGASLAFKGIENTVVMLHGSQGCSTYIRRHISTHFNEPIDIASSSLNEKGTVFGGAENLKTGIKNVMKVYNPKLIGIATTCLAETIGEDLEKIVKEHINNENIDEDNTKFVTVSTPGYGGSQYEGYYKAVRKTIEKITKKPYEKNNKLNVIMGTMSPADIRYVKNILKEFEIDYIMIPDISETMDSPFEKNYSKIPKGGTKIEDIEKMSESKATLEFGVLLNDENSPGEYLRDKYSIPLFKCPYPIGLENTDLFIKALKEFSGKELPLELNKSRGRMIDGMIDSHKYNGEGRAAIFGEPELVYSITMMCLENGIKPRVILTGSVSKKYKEELNKQLEKYKEESVILEDSDFDTALKYIKDTDTNILIGNSDGKFLHEKLNIPHVKIGFPNHDFMGAQRVLSVGYEGSILFLDRITNALIEEKHKVYREKMYSNYYEGRVI